MSKTTDLQKAFEGVGFEKLPAPIKKDLTYLSKEIRATELETLAPLIDNLVSLKNKVDSLQVTKDEKGNFEKDSIKEFKNLKSELRSFNASIRSGVDECKRPYMDINKSFIAIKKGFESEQSAMLDSIEVKFKEYLDEEEKKKAERAAKKEAALKAEIEAEKEASKAQMSQANKIMAYNKLKYDVLNDFFQGYKNKSLTYDIPNLKALHKELSEVNSLFAFFTLKSGEFEFDSLSDEQQADIISKYKVGFDETIELLNKTIAVKTQELQEAIEKAQEEKPVPVSAPIQTHSFDAEDVLVKNVIDHCNQSFLELDKYIVSHEAEDMETAMPLTYSLREQLRFIKNMKDGSNN